MVLEETMNRENFVHYSDNAPIHDYELFHKYAENIDEDGFDNIIKINLMQPILKLFT